MYCGSIGKSICTRRKLRLTFVWDFGSGCVHQRLLLGRAKLQTAFLFQEKAPMSMDTPAYTASRANRNDIEPSQIESSARNELCVAVISTLGCPYCKQVKSSLKLASIPFVEVDLSDHKECLQEVKSLTGKVTVPQVFVCGKLVGGAEETENAISSGSIWELMEDADGKGALPQSLQNILENSKIFEGRNLKNLIAILGEEMNTLEEFNSRHGFAEQDLVAWLETSKGMDPASITETITDLKTSHVIVREDNNHLVMLSSISIATRGDIKRPLNSHFQWYGEARHPVEVSEDLRRKLLKLYDTHMSADGRQVNYTGLLHDNGFRSYVDSTAELQKVNLDGLSGNEMKCFWINVYNSLIVHAITVHGPAKDLFQRLRWFGDISYDIGGCTFSANDIEHGILRANAPSPASLWSIVGFRNCAPPTFSQKDPRVKFAARKVDPRIHFALNCGASSCPPIKIYSSENLEEELDAAAEAFCQEEVEFIEGQNELSLSSIFKWYGVDFGTSKSDLISFLSKYSSQGTRNILQAALQSKDAESIKIKYKQYDWTTNSTNIPT